MLLTEILKNTRKEKYAVGSFSPRYLKAVKHVLLAAEELKSPAIVQISQNELNLYHATPKMFADELRLQLRSCGTTVPVTLHLDHTKDFNIIKEAIEAGFESVMIDSSYLELEENIAIVKDVVAYAHPRGVDVEAELGKIISNDRIETESDAEHYTMPAEAAYFVEQTKVDALAISVGTVHGAYTVNVPKIDIDRIVQIRKHTDVPLVLHGASGIPNSLLRRSYQLPDGGVSKINIATDLEQAFLAAIGSGERLNNEALNDYSEETLNKGWAAV